MNRGMKKLNIFVTMAAVVAVVAWGLWFLRFTEFPLSLPINSNAGAQRGNTAYDNPQVRINYPNLHFSTLGVTVKIYRKFLQDIRDLLQRIGGGGGEVHSIPRLREQGTVPNSERYILVELANFENSVTIAIDIVNVYVVGFQTRGATESYFFEDTYNDPARPHLFPGTEHIQLGYSSDYKSLHYQAEQNRQDVWLGIQNLDAAIIRLVASAGGNPREQARGLIVIIQMVSEAVRFRHIERNVVNSILQNRPFQPDGAMRDLENSFGTLSSAVQNANPENGVFQTPVRITTRDYTTLMVDHSRSVVGELLIMLFVCQSHHSALSFPATQLYQEDGMCLEAEPTVRMVGQNGLCAEAAGEGEYHHPKDPVLLRTCNELAKHPQLWTMKLDQTLRSGGKCMAASSFRAGSYIMISDCPNQPTDVMRWVMLDDGTILLSTHTNATQQTLVLSTPLGDADTELIIDTLGYHGPGQAWRATNNTKPFFTSIVSLRDERLCMTIDSRELILYLKECGEGIDGQMLALYADGSMRPQQQSSHCLTCDISLQPQSRNYVYLDPCNGIPGQRWVFEVDGTIRNRRTQYVLNVPEPDFDQKIIITPPGEGNQIRWYTTLY